MLTENRQRKIESVVANRQSGLVLVLEDIHDPHNAQAILRTCDAFGIQNVYFIFDQEKSYNPKKVGQVTSSSANKWLDFHIFKSTPSCLQSLKKQGFKIYATILDEKAKALDQIKFCDKKIAIMLGNEHRGLSAKAIKLADQAIYIPMKGMVQSLNVSVTAAIMIFEASRQRNKIDSKNRLSPREQKKLIKDFSQR
ncbi:MAG: RNA methyltransferase [Candidatus Buchananbacteria bacterium]